MSVSNLIVLSGDVWCAGSGCFQSAFVCEVYPSMTRTQVLNSIYKQVRDQGYCVTRDKVIYCPSCARKLRLRGYCSK